MPPPGEAYNQYGPGQDEQVQAHAPALGVLDVEPDHLFVGAFVAPADLPEPGDAGLDGEGLVMSRPKDVLLPLPGRAARSCGRRVSAQGRRRRRAGQYASPARSAASRSAGSSPTIVIPAGSTPRRSRSAARYGPFRSERSPRTSSEPDATIAARTPTARPRANRSS